MKQALVIGANGRFGSNMTKTLNEQGWRVRGLVRQRDRAPEGILHEDLFIGDCRDLALLERALGNATLVVYAVNPDYKLWRTSALAMLLPSIELAKRKGLHILFPGNVYVFEPSNQSIDEQQHHFPRVALGEVRAAMEQALCDAAGDSLQGMRVTIVRAGDFIEENGCGGWLEYILKPKGESWLLQLPHDDQHVHQWSYLPDLTRNALLAVLKQRERVAVWHDPGLTLCKQDWQDAFEYADLSVNITRFPWWFVIRLCSPFNRSYRYLLMMRYLWREQVLLNGEKMEREMTTSIAQTPLCDIVKRICGRSS